MAIIKCKSCGGTLEITDQTVATCEYCGLQQTLPKLNDERKANLYDRANHFRRNNEFDKAMGIYEQVLTSDPTDAESYWSLVLCRFGIEYVEDPATRKRIPTVNRAQYTSIFDDDNYKSALQYADGYQRQVYEEEAKTINEIQKGILAISQKEEPFDVFICYKETDNSGRRTHDSVLANDLYHQLTQEGFKVFFARITLEDKLGSAYEPYIFAALNSAKVMVVLGTKPEHFTAVWVRNEWSRYLSLIKGGAQKTLIPAYRDMDPYDLPEEFSHLQAQDMSKLGFMQDLIRGIKKIAQTEEPKPAVVMAAAAPTAAVAPLLRRAFMFLEDKDWAKADEFCEQVLNQEPENSEAYLGKLMAKLQASTREALRDCAMPFDHELLYQKAVRYGNAALVNELKGYIAHINERNENARLEGIYQNAVAMMSSNVYDVEHAHRRAADIFGSIPEYKDASARRDECLAEAEKARKNGIYDNARRKMRGDVIADYEAAIKLFETIPGWKDAEAQITECKNLIQTLREKQEAERLNREREKALAAAKQKEQARKRKKITTIAAIACGIVVTLICLFNFVIIPNLKYNAAIALMNKGMYAEAYMVFNTLNGHKDSAELATVIYQQYKLPELKKASVGSYVTFGFYEQDDYPSNGKEDIKWLVLAKENNRLLVISRYALDCKRYNETYTNVTWETCTLRKWLNNDFLNAAFSSSEQALIPAMTVSATENPDSSTNQGNSTKDRVFLLSVVEANKYFASDSARECKPTRYAQQQGISFEKGEDVWWWWLRSTGNNQKEAAVVKIDGSVYGDGFEITRDGGYTLNARFKIGTGTGAVRPAMWIDLEP